MLMGDIDLQPVGSTPIPQHKGRLAGIGSRLLALGKAAAKEGRRNARLASLKAQITKLRHVDLKQAHLALAEYCYGGRHLADRFSVQFEEINQIGQQIEEKRAGHVAEENATTAQKLQRTAANMALKAEAGAQSVKLKNLLVSLGAAVATTTPLPAEMEPHLADVKAINTKIDKLEREAATVEMDRSSGMSRLLLFAIVGVLVATISVGSFFAFHKTDGGLVLYELGSSPELEAKMRAAQAKEEDEQLERYAREVEQEQRDSSKPVVATTCSTCVGKGTITTPNGYTAVCPTCGGTCKVGYSAPQAFPK